MFEHIMYLLGFAALLRRGEKEREEDDRGKTQ